MSDFASADRIKLMGARRLERLIRTADLSRQALLHSTWILLLLTWCVAWPGLRWLAQHHEAVTRIEPPAVAVQSLGGEDPVPPYLRLEAVPRLRHALDVTQADGTNLFYVPLVAGPRESEVVRVVALGLSRHLLDAKSPTAIAPPYALQLDPAGVPERVRREMARRGVKFADTVYFFRSIELVQGRVPNRHGASDQIIEAVVTMVGSAVSGLCFVGWILCVLRLKRLRALSPAGVLP